jgi:L-arabinose isomerase
MPEWVHWGRHHGSAVAHGAPALPVTSSHEMHDLHQVVVDKDSSSPSASDASNNDVKRRLTDDIAHRKSKKASHHHGKHK